MKICVLDSSIFNRIAAGEVVESPCSVVKELVENSIDASATKISIEIKNGGIDFIQVTDDGKGIEKQDMPTAFLPHATSKIASIDDLEKITTLGFRGEALPSIASVARVTMISRIEADNIGNMVIFENGRLISQCESGSFLGTRVTVEGLFQNIPARLKFLKKPSIESAKITDLVSKLILANYNISIKYSIDSKTIFHSDGKGLESALYTIYGKSIENLIPTSSTMSGIVLKGYISKPSYTKHNKSFQTLIVNNRVVENDELSYYVYLCYKDYLMQRQYPMFVLYLDVPIDMIDVNVHPNKTQVKFSDQESIKKLIMSSVKNSVDTEARSAKNISVENLNIDFGAKESASTITTPKIDNLNVSNDSPNASKHENYSISPKKNSEIKTNRIYNELFGQGSMLTVNEGVSWRERLKTNETEKAEILFQNNNLNDSNSNSNGNGNSNSKNSNFTNTPRENSKCDSDSVKSFLSGFDIKIIGKAFNTYIIIEKDTDLFLIDQHAAHEKLIYDKFILAIDNNLIATQPLLLPYVFELNYSECALLDDNLDEFEKLGFMISKYSGNNYSLSTVPVICSNINFKEFVNNLVNAINSKQFKKSDFIKEAVMSSACKAAVKGKDELKIEEIEHLLSEMKQSDQLFCPHGRPTVIRLSRSEIEKWFKRIV